ncbi:MAG: PHP domain-containing protein [Betaproteobacteria bacterium]|nr:PHP domain-containing protein [Betaproteobacteria bacterium]
MPPPARTFDFHCHSNISDGFLPPTHLVEQAAKQGVRHLALTDHDDVGGLAEARAQASALDIRFTNGIEISIEWEGISIHILGLDFDPATLELLNGLEWIRDGRVKRAKKMGQILEELGIPGAYEGALRHASNPALISRAHFARYLVEIGMFSEPQKVFKRYLSPGKPGYVCHETAQLPDCLNWLKAANGVAVVAHPGRYPMRAGQMQRFLSEFKDLGGEAIEVSSNGYATEHIRHFARLAREFGFYASGGSDFHGPPESYARLGEFAPIPEDLPLVTKLFKD